MSGRELSLRDLENIAIHWHWGDSPKSNTIVIDEVWTVGQRTCTDITKWLSHEQMMEARQLCLSQDISKYISPTPKKL